MLKGTCTILNRKTVAAYEQPTQKQKKKEYGQTCIQRPCIQRSPYILRLLDNSPKVELYRTVTPLKQMRSGPLQTPKMHDCIIFYLCIKVDKQDYDQVMSKLCYVSSKVHGKMNTSEIVKSVNLIMAIEWGELQALDELNIQFSLQETYIYWSPIS